MYRIIVSGKEKAKIIYICNLEEQKTAERTNLE